MAADTEGEYNIYFSALTQLSGLLQPQLSTVQTPQKKTKNLLAELEMREYTKAQCQHD